MKQSFLPKRKTLIQKSFGNPKHLYYKQSSILYTDEKVFLPDAK